MPRPEERSRILFIGAVGDAGRVVGRKTARRDFVFRGFYVYSILKTDFFSFRDQLQDVWRRCIAPETACVDTRCTQYFMVRCGPCRTFCLVARDSFAVHLQDSFDEKSSDFLFFSHRHGEPSWRRHIARAPPLRGHH